MEHDRRRVLVYHASLFDGQAAAVDNHLDTSDGPEVAVTRAGKADTIRSVIEQIPETFREALVLREMGALSYRKIGALTACRSAR